MATITSNSSEAVETILLDESNATGLDGATLESMRHGLESDNGFRLMQNAVTSVSIDEIAVNRSVLNSVDHTFSTLLDDWKVTNQKQSGRCWMFAGLNLFRVGAMKKMNVSDFEFSQNYTLFWDKLERANYFLEMIINTASRSLEDRLVSFLLDGPLDDGGQWNMFINIVNKHGLVPKAAMPETQSSSSTRRMNRNLLTILRKGACMVREAIEKSGVDAGREVKDEVVANVHRVLCIHLGTPPEKVHWQWHDKDKGFTRDEVMTPVEFAKKYVTLPIDDYVCLVNDPRPGSPIGRTFTVEGLGNVVGGSMVKYLNIDIETMKRITMESLVDQEPVWMGCDVGPMMHRKLGIWDARMFEYDMVYEMDMTTSKEQRLLYHDTCMTHAMLFTGVDVVEEGGGSSARRWRVENSWGDDSGNKGFFVMNDSWFDEYMFEIAAHRDRLPDELKDAIDQDPIVLPAWDPMGSLAGRRTT
ncbi:MAG: aminopeptidase [Phycisphaerae bacterium]|nr:aminopeptidase [Phycisphaerae bacterium]